MSSTVDTPAETDENLKEIVALQALRKFLGQFHTQSLDTRVCPSSYTETFHFRLAVFGACLLATQRVLMRVAKSND